MLWPVIILGGREVGLFAHWGLAYEVCDLYSDCFGTGVSCAGLQDIAGHKCEGMSSEHCS